MLDGLELENRVKKYRFIRSDIFERLLVREGIELESKCGRDVLTAIVRWAREGSLLYPSPCNITAYNFQDDNPGSTTKTVRTHWNPTVHKPYCHHPRSAQKKFDTDLVESCSRSRFWPRMAYFPVQKAETIIATGLRKIGVM